MIFSFEILIPEIMLKKRGYISILIFLSFYHDIEYIGFDIFTIIHTKSVYLYSIE